MKMKKKKKSKKSNGKHLGIYSVKAAAADLQALNMPRVIQFAQNGMYPEAIRELGVRNEEWEQDFNKATAKAVVIRKFAGRVNLLQVGKYSIDLA